MLYLGEFLWNTLDEFLGFGYSIYFKLRTKLDTGKTIVENLTLDINATNIKYIENYLFLNTSLLA